jgi:nitrogenase molybdenum-iron protein alpha/beta subunit
MIELLPGRAPQVVRKANGSPTADMACGKASVAGSVSQRACVFCGYRAACEAIYQLVGIGFCDHNHERKEPLAGFIGMLNFAKEVYASVASPVWQFAPRRAKRGTTI